MAGFKFTPLDFYVYVHCRATDGRIFYVGKGFKQRAWSASKRNAHWNNIVKKHGFYVEIVQDGMQEWWAFELERELIALHGRGSKFLCNATDGGDGSSGAERSLETRKKLSDAHKKFNLTNPMLGKKHKNSSKQKQSIKKIGKYVGTRHPRCSVSVDDVLSVKNLRATTNMTCKAIAEQLKISFHVVRNIVYQKSWSHTNENS